MGETGGSFFEKISLRKFAISLTTVFANYTYWRLNLFFYFKATYSYRTVET